MNELNSNKSDAENKSKYAKRLVYVCDQGHYGLTVCSNCNSSVEEYFNVCPSCLSIFDKEDDVSYNRGGSDF